MKGCCSACIEIRNYEGRKGGGAKKETKIHTDTFRDRTRKGLRVALFIRMLMDGGSKK